MTDPAGGLEAARAFYDGTYHAAPAAAPGWHERAIAARLGDLRGKRVLDVACGAGHWLALLRARGAEVAGVDLSERAIARARAVLPGATLHQGPAEALPFPDAGFDLVTCLGSLEHFQDQPKALAEMVRVARPDARFLILVPNAGFPTRRLGLFRGTAQAAVREDVRTLDAWAALLREAGLEVEARWRDLHVLSPGWIMRGPWWMRPLRAAQAVALALWPLGWQYQVYHLCRRISP